MALICKLLGHRAGAEVWNDGLYFSACARCGVDLIRQRNGTWYPVPAGFRVQWRAEGSHALHWSKAMSLAHQARRRARRRPTQ